jgi:hypothetical protein
MKKITSKITLLVILVFTVAAYAAENPLERVTRSKGGDKTDKAQNSFESLKNVLDGKPVPSDKPVYGRAKSEVQCKSMGGVWDESTLAVFGRVTCREPKAGEKPGHVIKAK